MIKRIIKQIETPIDLISQIITELGGGGGGSSQQYIDGEVEYHQYLPTGIGNPATNTAFLVKKGQGVWLINRKPAGIWVRETDNGDLNDWVYAGSFPDVYNDANFRIYDNDDSSKNLAFNLNDLNSNTTVTLTIPPSGGTVITNNNLSSQLPNTILYTTGNQVKSGRLIIGHDANGIVDPNSPYTLSVQTNYGSTWLEILNNSGAGQGVFFGINGNDFEQYSYQGGDILFFTSETPGDGTVRLRIKNDGKIGIGTDSPSEKLEVSGNVKANNLVYNTGDQTISGLKDFATRPTVNTVPVALSGEASSNIEQLVKNDSNTTLYKGQPVYVSGSNGNNILIRPASNSGEGTSSKTFGLLKQTLLNNAQGYVVTEGPLLNVDTSMANEGDPIWLGPTGNLIYGLANKPKAPQHLVSLGFVERAHQNQGKIFVKVQNGFEIEELHDVRIINKQNSDILIYNTGSGLWLNSGVNFNNFYTVNNPSGFITGVNLSNYVTNTNLQKLQVQLPTGIEIYTGTFGTVFSAAPTVIATIQVTGLFNYITTLVSVTTSGFVTDFSDIIGESGVMLNIIAYN